ncbi:MAG TPA: HEAT repeat domain-containing protein, partial [Opitutales bacterium]|nr:HEAT repeat domain-containing protein [Opitutales bacterium]
MKTREKSQLKGRAAWIIGLLALVGLALAMTAIRPDREDLADFNFDDPPSSYEKGIEVANRDQVFRVDGLRFEAAPLEWKHVAAHRPLPNQEDVDPQYELNLDIGEASGYEIVEIRLFDHETREIFFTSDWRAPNVENPGFLVERIGDSSTIRIRETGGKLPEKMDVWLRVAVNDTGPVFSIPPIEGAMATRNGSELVVTELFAGTANGRTGPTGGMAWDFSSLRDQDRSLTLNLENRGRSLKGRYLVVAVSDDGSRHSVLTSFQNFLDKGPKIYVRIDVPLGDVDHFELIPFKGRHKFFFNGLEVPGAGDLPELGRSGQRKLQRWFKRYQAGELSERDLVSFVAQRGPYLVPGLIEYFSRGGTDRIAMKAIEQFEGHPQAVGYIERALEEMVDTSEHHFPNRKHCCLVLLGKMGNESHVDLIARYIAEKPYAALPALAEIGSDRAVKQLGGAFELLPEEDWWVIAENLGRTGKASALPVLKERLAMVELPPTERFTPNAVPAFIDAIHNLTGKEEPHVSAFSGFEFKQVIGDYVELRSYSLQPTESHEIRYRKGERKFDAQLKALKLATTGPGFTVQDGEVVLFNGLRAMTIWEEGPPYPLQLYDLLHVVSHRALQERALGEAARDRMPVPEKGVILALAPNGHLSLIFLKGSGPPYNTSILDLDPLRLLVEDDQSDVDYAVFRSCILRDMETRAKGGAMNLSRGHTMDLKHELWAEPGHEAVLALDYMPDKVALGVPGADEFVLVEAVKDISADELVQQLALAR